MNGFWLQNLWRTYYMLSRELNFALKMYRFGGLP